MKVLVTSAAGHQSKALIPKLSAAGHWVRAVRLSPGKDDELKALGAQEVIAGDLSDAGFYAEVLDGCDALFHVGPGGMDREVEKGLAMIDAAKRCNTRHVVMASCHQSIINIVQHRYKRDIEEKLYESGLNYTVLKPCDFMMTEMHIDPVLKLGALPVFWNIKPGRRGSLIDVADIAEVAFKVLNESDKHFYANYELVGTDKLTPNEMARILSRVLGREIQVAQSSPNDLLELMVGLREPTPELQHFYDVLASISNWYAQHDYIGNPNILEWLLGRKPTTFEQYLRRVFAERGIPCAS